MKEVIQSSARVWGVEIEVCILSTVIWEGTISGFRSKSYAENWRDHFMSLTPAGCTAKARYTNYPDMPNEITTHLKMVVDQIMKK